MRRLLTFPLLFSLFQCGQDETLSGYGASDIDWALVEINKTAFTATATLRFPEEGVITGDAPCNSFTGTQTAPYPWFEVTDVAVTRTTCANIAAEAQMLSMLQTMTLVEVSPNAMILTNDAGDEMVLRAAR